MSRVSRETIRIVSIAFNARGIGFAIIDGNLLLDWGTVGVMADSKRSVVERMMQQIEWYEPTLVVFEDIGRLRRRSKRSLRIARELRKRVRAMGTPVALTKAVEARRTLEQLGRRIVVKADLIPVLIGYFPQLASSAPPERKTWMGEDYRMAIFVALSLALCNLHRLT